MAAKTKLLIEAEGRAALPGLIDALGLSEESRGALERMLDDFASHHGTRWLTVSDVRRSVVTDHPEHLASYDAFSAALPPQGAPYAFVWSGYHCLMMYRAASLVFPGLDFLEMGQAWVTAGMNRFFTNPGYLMMRKAIGNDIGELIDVMFKDNPFFNFGKQTVHRQGPRQYTVYGTETYATWVELLLVPFARALFAEFGVRGEATFGRLSAHSFEIEMSW